MKLLLTSMICLICMSSNGTGQDSNANADTIRVIFENEKLIVTEYASTPGKDICGKGKHMHAAHLTILLTDAKARLFLDNGNTQDFDLKAGTTFWSEAETHMVINNGGKPAKLYLLELKQ